MTTKQKHASKLSRMITRARRANAKEEVSVCQVCGQEIFRIIYPGEPAGPWWHDLFSLDFRHRPIPKHLSLRARIKKEMVTTK